MSKEIFEENPSLDTVYQTSDENYFYSQNAAENHAKTLKDKTVKKHTNPSKKVAVEDVENVEEQIFFQTGENTDGSPKIEIEPQTEIAIDNLIPPDKPLLAEKVNVDSVIVADEVKEILEKGTEALKDDGDSADEYDQAISNYKEKFGEAPYEGAELKKIKWAIQFNKQLIKPE